MVRNSLEWLGIVEVVVKVYISEGEFSQISVEFVEMIFTFPIFVGSFSSSSSSSSSNPFSFSNYFCASSFICSGYSCSSTWDPRVLLILILVAVLLIISIFLFFKFIQFFQSFQCSYFPSSSNASPCVIVLLVFLFVCFF